MEILARAVGRRKEAVAQVQIVRGTGQFIINNKVAQEYLHNNSCSLLSVKAPFEILQKSSREAANSPVNKGGGALAPLFSREAASNGAPATLNLETFDTIVKVKGGGLIGQAEAIKLGVARALCDIESLSDASLSTNDASLNSMNGPTEIRKQLKTKGYLTQDSRVKERKKYGLKKARKASQYNKR